MGAEVMMTGGMCGDKEGKGVFTTSSLAFGGAWRALVRVALNEEDVSVASSSLSRIRSVRVRHLHPLVRVR